MSVRECALRPECMAHIPDDGYRWLELHHQGEAYGHAALAERGSDLELHLTLIRWGPLTRRRLAADADWLRTEAVRLGKRRVLGLRAVGPDGYDPRLFRFARLFGFKEAWVLQAAAMAVEPDRSP
ncbi:hypothetical protein GKC30_06350 [Pseudodesulfovibrio sp. F-1]|uniref:Uncharacterized protein n=1 Tax=Pseudodesulfovibrio alkaliphilus TaxID=2661613 RepID=A0A7K1KMK1_9BACT|nr:hypothetical protein [Pseudodesulfovibrio alkaliphilus]MUM77247.1 hypothetical protein [Pseudodesulfovibrio alkaliphilus]